METSFIKKLSTIGDDIELNRRALLLFVFSLLGILFLTVYGISAWFQEYRANAVFNFSAATVYILNLVIYYRWKKLYPAIYISIGVISALYIYLYVSGGIRNTSFIWYFTYPLFTCYLLGSSRGLLFSSLMLFPVLTLMALDFNSPFIADYDTEFESRFIGAYLVIVLFSYFFERSNEKIRKELLSKNENLEHEMLTSEEEHSMLIESMHDAFSRTDLECRILSVNKAYEELTGYNAEELRGRSCTELTPEQWHDFEKEIFTEQILKNGYSDIYEKEYVRKDGTVIPVELRAFLIKDTNGKPKGMWAIVRDIEARKNELREKEQEVIRRQHTQKLESIGTLAGGIAHDFNNILSSILGFTELALDDAPKDSILEDNLQEVYIAGKRAKDLVKQILAFARQSEEAMVPIRVDTIAKEAVKFIRSSIPATVKIQPAIESDAVMMGNTTQMHQIFLNLCTNAAHAMEENGGTLEIKLTDIFIDLPPDKATPELDPGKYIELLVSDTGTGISPEIIDHIFEPYFTTKKQGEGTGMGLAMVHGIVKSYGGKISVDSTLGKGSTFTVLLPAVETEAASPFIDSTAPPTGSERILYIDDEVPIARMGNQMLSKLGYHVTTRTSSTDALELFRSKPDAFDLVITDMTMPNMTGDRLATEIMTIRPDIPIILCTGYSKKITDKEASAIGIRAFAYKPIIKSELATTVRQVLDQN